MLVPRRTFLAMSSDIFWAARGVFSSRVIRWSDQAARWDSTCGILPRVFCRAGSPHGESAVACSHHRRRDGWSVVSSRIWIPGASDAVTGVGGLAQLAHIPRRGPEVKILEIDADMAWKSERLLRRSMRKAVRVSDKEMTA